MDASQIIKKWDQLKSDRSTWESHWQDVTDYVIPRKNNVITTQTPGAKKAFELFDTTAVESNKRMAAGLYSYLCPPNQMWFGLKAKNKDQNDVEEIKQWLLEAGKSIYEALNGCNFSLEIHEHFLDLGTIGTGCLYLEDGDKTLLNFRNFHISEYAILENAQGVIDTVYRRFSLTARQAVQQFGEENLGEQAKASYRDPNKQEEKFYFIHVICPRIDADASKKDAKNKPIASIYVDVSAQKIISESGYDEMPALTPRFVKASNEIYGRSPAMDVLPDIKMVNKMGKTTIKAAEKVVDPPILIPDDGAFQPFRTTPGGLNYYRPIGNSKPEPFITNANIGLGLEMENQRREVIKSAFFNDLFNMLADRTNMTATEVLERVEEKMVMLGPILGRLQSELFNPLIHRSLGILMRAGLIPQPPAGLEAYEVEYVNKLALAMKLQEIKAMANTLQFIAPIAQNDPEILDNFDFDKVSRGVASNYGIPTDWMRPVEDIDQIRQGRQQALAQQQQAQQAAQMAQAITNLQKPTDETSPLGVLSKKVA